MARRLPEGLTREHVAPSSRTDSGQLAWLYPAILEVVATLAANGYATLGGEVLYLDVKKGTFSSYHGDMYCGNWYLDWRGDEY